jgi:CO/xanthine dehydrogenase Mo-binding subunit
MRARRLDRKSFLTGVGVLVVGFGLENCSMSHASQPAKSGAGSSSGAAEANPNGAPSEPNVASWLAIDAHGITTVYFGKVELGTGVETAISQLVADELVVPIASVRVVQGDTSRTPNQGYTSGSQTLTAGAIPVRKAAAEARRILVDLAAKHFAVGADALAVRDGTVYVAAAPARSVAYGALLDGKRFDGTIDDAPAMRPVAAYRYVGKPVPRIDLPGKVVGTFPYLQNLRVPGMLHARMVLPPNPGATIASIDASSLAGIPEKVRVVRSGAILAVVAADETHAIAAARKLAVVWNDGPALPSYDGLYAAVEAIPGTDRTLANAGDTDAALERASRTIEARYEWPYQSHGSIGPSCAVADVRDGKAVVWSATQGVFPLRGAIAELLGFDPKDVRVRYAEGAGCYGHNGADDAAAFAALLSQSVNAPIRLQYSRADETRHSPKGPAMAHTLRGGVGADGTIAAWEMHVRTPTHSLRPDGVAGHTLPGIMRGAPQPPIRFAGGDRNAKTNYRFANERVTITNQKTAVLRASALRGLGAPQNCFANESFFDELAHAAKGDPFAMRLAHLADPRERAVLEALRADYTPGRGIAFVHYENTEAIVGVVADVTVDRASGAIRVNHLFVAHDCGLIVNPDGLRNQIEGAAIQGTSRALKEQVVFDPHHVIAQDWVSYPILTFSEVPEVTIRLIDRPNDKILGAGEATTVIVAPAIANAVFAQTGARLRRVPFLPRDVRAALKAATA